MHRATQAVLGLFLLGMSFLMSVPAASGADDCEATVVDQTSKQVLDVSKIEANTQDLTLLGADVRVRAFQKLPSGNIDSWFKKEVASCDSWQGPDGASRIKGNLIVFAFSLDDHKSLINYGPTTVPSSMG